MSEPRTPTGPARRAVLRWAWRLFRREWRQQLLTIVLLTLAVAAAVWASTVAVNGGSKARGTLGDAKAMIRLDQPADALHPPELSQIEARFGPAEAVAHSSATVAGLARPVDVRAQDPSGRFGHSLLSLRDGRYPEASTEVALTQDLADQLSAHVGGQVALGDATWTVVGLVENPRNLDDEFALAAPSASLPHASSTVLLGRDRPLESASADGGGQFDVISLGDDNAGLLTLVVAAVTVSMALVGLIATSGFVVLAQRRRRQLGLLAALGATERQLRLVFVASGTLIGVVAAVVGSVLGVGAWLATAPTIEHASAHRIGRFDLPWPLLALCIALAIAAATAAAWWPARSVSRAPVMVAIAQRPSPPLAVHRSAALATVLVLGGVVVIALAKPRDAQVSPWLLIVGLLAVIAGTILIAPTAIRVVAMPAARLPISARVALRDLVRYQARAAAALAAITLALAISVATAVVAKASADDRGPGNLSEQQLLVSAGATDGPFAATIAPADVGARDRAVGALAEQIGASALALDVAVPAPSGSRPPEPVSVAKPVDHGFQGVGPAYVATPEVLARFGIDPASVDPSTELLTDRSDVMLLDVSTRPDSDASQTAIQHATLSPYSVGPQALVTTAAVRRHGWTTQRLAWLVESDHVLTHDDLAAARAAAAAAGLVVESRDGGDDVAAVGRLATGIGALLALAILAATIGLIRGEAIADTRTMTAVGAPRRTRRAITATAAGTLALVGVALATTGAYIAIAAAYRSDLAPLSSPPVTNLVLLVVGLPLLAAAAGWLLAGREPSHLARQPG